MALSDWTSEPHKGRRSPPSYRWSTPPRSYIAYEGMEYLLPRLYIDDGVIFAFAETWEGVTPSSAGYCVCLREPDN